MSEDGVNEDIVVRAPTREGVSGDGVVARETGGDDDAVCGLVQELVERRRSFAELVTDNTNVDQIDNERSLTGERERCGFDCDLHKRVTGEGDALRQRSS